jgi:hypothetical protein
VEQMDQDRYYFASAMCFVFGSLDPLCCNKAGSCDPLFVRRLWYVMNDVL